MIRTAIIAAALLAPGIALADPCTAIPDRGPKPAWIKPGATFAGTVRHTIDGDGLCISTSPVKSTWIEVRLANFYAPELHEPGGAQAKAALERITAGRQAVCTVGGGRNGRVISYDRVIARCTVGGVDLGELMRREGIQEGGRGR